MSIFTMRETLKQAYPDSKTWSKRVSNMTEGQVTAIFFRLKREGKI
jgi:hypothetical protein